jgi:hypothetical protein
VNQTFTCNLFMEASWLDKGLLENGQARDTCGKHTCRSSDLAARSRSAPRSSTHCCAVPQVKEVDREKTQQARPRRLRASSHSREMHAVRRGG